MREDFSIVLGEVLKVEINEDYLESDQLIEDPLTMLNGEFRGLKDLDRALYSYIRLYKLFIAGYI